ncbi:MAG: TolC family protein [Phycisphaeraceae bacterium]|nr:TolC family protein [Phycisphaeraceae bacterium]
MLGIAGVAGALAGGCNSGMDSIDRRIDAMLQNRSAELRSNAVPANDYRKEAAQTSDQKIRDHSLATDPKTNNPTAGDLTYPPEQEARDVTARLTKYADEAYGTNTEGAGLRDARDLDLASSWRIAQRSSREYLTAEEDYLLAVISLLAEQHRWEPRLFNDTTFAGSNTWNDGTPQSALSVINTLRVQKKLPYGGQVEAAWVANAGQQLVGTVSSSYVQASSVRLAASVPLLRGAGMVAREPLIQAERDVIYRARTFERFRRQLLVSVAGDYFQLVQVQSQIANQMRSLESLRTFQQATQARVDAGRIRAFEVNIAANDVLNAEAALANLREQYILQLDRFKVRLGLEVSERVIIRPLALEIPMPDSTLDTATRAALEYRLDLQNTRDRVDDARRAVANAQNETLPSLNVGATALIITDPNKDIGGINFSPEDSTITGSATLSLPLDNEIERLNVRSATIALQQRERGLDQARDNVVVSVRSALRNIDLAAFQLKLAEQQVQINKRRLEEQLLKIDEVDAKQVVDSQNALLLAENRRDQAKTDLRNSILNYLLESDQLRVAPDGTFQPLPGMNLTSATQTAPGAGDPPVMGDSQEAANAAKQAP